MTQDDKKFVCCIWYLKNCLSYDFMVPYIICYWWYTCVKWWYSKGFFHFFQKISKNLWDVKERESMIEGVKGKKFVQTEKKFCLSRPIPQEPYITWFLLMVLMCKMTIPPGVFLYFSKNFVCHAWYFRNYTSYDCHLQ